MGWLAAGDTHGITLVEGRVVARSAPGARPEGGPGGGVPEEIRDRPEVIGLQRFAEWLDRHGAECAARVGDWMVSSLPVPTALLARVWPDEAWRRVLRMVRPDGEPLDLTARTVTVPHPVLIPGLAAFRARAAGLGVTQGVEQLDRGIWHRPEAAGTGRRRPGPSPCRSRSMPVPSTARGSGWPPGPPPSATRSWGYAKGLSSRGPDATAFRHLRRLFVQLAAHGLAPSSPGAADLRKLARAVAGKQALVEETAHVREMLLQPGTVKAPPGWWKAHRRALLELTRKEPPAGQREGGREADGTWWPQNPAASVPDLVTEAAGRYGLGQDAAVLHLMLLAMPDPTDRNTARWTGWQRQRGGTARLRAARAELAASGLLVEGVRTRAGRSLFLPGGWAALAKPHIPLERWKLPLFDLLSGEEAPLGTVVPTEPVAALYRRAWQRVRDGDEPRAEELEVPRPRTRRR